MARLLEVLGVLAVLATTCSSAPVAPGTNAQTKQDQQIGPKVGIVGAGVGGSVAAFLLRRLLGPTAKIFVYDFVCWQHPIRAPCIVAAHLLTCRVP